MLTNKHKIWLNCTKTIYLHMIVLKMFQKVFISHAIKLQQ